MTIRAVVFDLGHTLWDITPQPEALANAYVEMRATLTKRTGRDDLPSAAQLQRAVRDVLQDAARTYFMDGPELREPPPRQWVSQACRNLGLDLEPALVQELTPPLFATEIGGLVVGEGTLEAVTALSADGYALGCITNTLADSAAIRAMLERYRFAPLMSSVVVSTEEGWRKPHLSLFQKSLRQLTVAPTEALFVGDSPIHDVGGAKAAGMFAVLTRQYVSRPEPPGVAQPDAYISHLSELPGVIADLDWSEKT